MKFLVSLLISLALMHHAHSVCVIVRSGDTCRAIEAANQCASGSIIANTRGVNADCTNLAIGQEVCCYGAAAVAPVYPVYPTYPVYPSYPVYPNGQYPSTYNGASNGCTYVAAGETCSSVEARMKWAPGTIISSNSGVNGACTNLGVGQYVCGYYNGGNTYNNGGSTYNNNCYTVVSGDNCASIEARFNWPAGTIVANNPKVNSGCTNLSPGDYICGTYAGAVNTYPIAPGTTNGCTYVNAGEGCADVENRMRWSTGSIIMSSNGGVNSLCTNLRVGQTVCGYPLNTGVVYPVNPVPVNPVIVNPVPVNPVPITTGCARYTVVNSGQTCYSIATSLGISAAALINANPSLGADCSGLYLGQQLCF